jgi:hypothetical protein
MGQLIQAGNAGGRFPEHVLGRDYGISLSHPFLPAGREPIDSSSGKSIEQGLSPVNP